MPTVLTLPFPPSANNLFPSSRSGRRFLSPEYKAWREHAGLVLNTQPFTPHKGEVRVLYELHRPDRRRRDLGNLEKAVGDLLVSQGVIEDDSKIVELTLRWAEVTRVTIWDA